MRERNSLVGQIATRTHWLSGLTAVTSDSDERRLRAIVLFVEHWTPRAASMTHARRRFAVFRANAGRRITPTHRLAETRQPDVELLPDLVIERYVPGDR